MRLVSGASNDSIRLSWIRHHRVWNAPSTKVQIVVTRTRRFDVRNDRIRRGGVVRGGRWDVAHLHSLRRLDRCCAAKEVSSLRPTFAWFVLDRIKDVAASEEPPLLFCRKSVGVVVQDLVVVPAYFREGSHMYAYVTISEPAQQASISRELRLTSYCSRS